MVILVVIARRKQNIKLSDRRRGVLGPPGRQKVVVIQ
jgi:hypothetical protein